MKPVAGTFKAIGWPANRSRESTTSADTRVHYLDNLRAGAMLGGVFLHAAFAYAHPSQSFWLATDSESNSLIDASIWFIHLFRMSLFFLLAGYLAKRAVSHKGFGTWAANRAIRLIAPFAIFYPLLLGAMGIVIQFGLSYQNRPSGLLGLIASGSHMEPEGASGILPSTMHLWFLYYLILFSALSFLAIPLKWIRFGWMFDRPLLLLLAPLSLVPAIIGSGFPLPSPESVIPTWWPFGFYGLFYWFGWQLFGRELTLERLEPHAWLLLGASVLLFLPYYYCLPELDLLELLQRKESMPVWQFAVGATLTAYLSVSLTVCCWLLGKRYLAGRIAGLRLLADASYWIYLIHLPVVIFLQTLLIPAPWSIWLKLLVVMGGTTFFCLATYLVFVRYTPLGWLLHGKRSFP